MNTLNSSGPIFFKEDSWYHRTKILNEDLTITYGEKGGYETEESAAEAYVEHLSKFKAKIGLLKERQSISYSFKEYLIYWYHNIFIPRSDTSTKMVTGHVLYNFIIPSLTAADDIPLTAVTTTMLNKLMKRCKMYCETSAKQTHKLLSSAFYDAYVDGLIKVNHMQYADKYYWNQPKPAVLYSKDQLKTFLSYISRFYRQIYLEVCMALFCGMRTGEIRGFCFSDADPVDQTIHIQRQVTADFVVCFTDDTISIKRAGVSKKPPKSESSDRLLRVHSVIFELLEERKKTNQELQEKCSKTWNHDYDGYVCLGTNGNIKSDGTFNEALKRVCSRTGLPTISMHDLRHMAASMLFESGVELLRISKFLGHSNPNTTFDIYIHQMEQSERLKNVIDQTFEPYPSSTTTNDIRS